MPAGDRLHVFHRRITGVCGPNVDPEREILGLCADAGLVSVGVVAVDGSKLAASASDRAVRSYEQIAGEILEEAGRVDAAEDGSTVPPAATSCPSIWPGARDGGPGCARQSSASIASAPSAPSGSRKGAPSGSDAASAGWLRTGRRSGCEPRIRGPLGARCARARPQADGLGAAPLHPAHAARGPAQHH
jgi:hypothetical protein